MKSHFFVAALLVAGLCGGQPTAALTLPSHRHSVNISGVPCPIVPACTSASTTGQPWRAR